MDHWVGTFLPVWTRNNETFLRADRSRRHRSLLRAGALRLCCRAPALGARRSGAGVNGYLLYFAVLVAALPTAGWVFIFASRYEADAGRTSAAILWTTTLAFLSFSGLVWLLGIGRPG